MSKFTLVSAGAAIAAALSAVLVLFVPRLGITMFGLCVLALVLVGIWQIHRIARLQATMHRNSKEFHRLEKHALARLDQKMQRILDAPTIERSGTSSRRPRPSGLAGRAATPDVSNDATELTLGKAIDPSHASRRRVVIGVFSSSTREYLQAADVTVHRLRRGAVIEHIEEVEAATLVIDEDAFDGGDWYGLLDAPGTGRAKEMVEGIRHAQSRGMLVVLLRATRPIPHVNGAALRVRGVTVLPLDEAGWGEASEAPLAGSILPLLQQLAISRDEVSA